MVPMQRSFRPLIATLVATRRFLGGGAPAILAPPFTRETALAKVRKAEDAWNSRDPEKVSLAYTPDSVWRNRSEFLEGREAIKEFLTKKWERELDYRLIKELVLSSLPAKLWNDQLTALATLEQWAFDDDQIAVRFQYEYHDAENNWFRAYGNENWQFDEQGLMKWRQASINDVPIQESDRKFLWEPQGRRPDDYPGLLELGL